MISSSVTRLTLVLILLSVILSAGAQLLLKAGVSAPDVQRAAASNSAVAFVTAVLTQPLVWCGLVAFGSSAVTWILVLSRAPVSFAYPFVALGLVLTVLFGSLLFGEAMNPAKLSGIALIVTGVLVIAGGVA